MLHIVFRNGEYIGDVKALIQIAIHDFDIKDASISSRSLFSRMVKDETEVYYKKTRHYIFMKFADENNEKSVYGKIVIELFADICPKACNHFLTLCLGNQGVKPNTDILLQYEKCPVHRKLIWSESI